MSGMYRRHRMAQMAKETVPAPETPAAPDTAMERMTVPELEAFAQARGIDLSEARTKADKVAAIRRAMA